MYCHNCGIENEDTSRFCSSCGTSLKQVENNIKAPEVTEKNNEKIETQYTKQICLVCKGKGKQIKKLHAIISLILGLIVFPIVAVATGGVALFASLAILVWGFKKKPCKVCSGTGFKVM